MTEETMTEEMLSTHAPGAVSSVGLAPAAPDVPTASNGDSPDASEQSKGFVIRLGPIVVDWPRSLGYFGAAAAAVALDIVEPPLGLFIAAVPFLKMLSRSDSSRPVRFAGQVVDGASKPVGGDSEGTIRYESDRSTSEP